MISNSPETILLWDIDGTLISGGGAGERALERTAQALLGQTIDLSTVDYHGRTDLRISRMLFEITGQNPSHEEIHHFGQHYLTLLEEEMGRSSKAHVKPGIERILAFYDEHPRAVQGLLTGNLVAGARIKLAPFSLFPFFSLGAFADHSEDRNELSLHALQLIRQNINPDFPPSSVVVIGDTPHDITCGQKIGARTVGVATGNYSASDLLQASPDAVFEDFSEPRVFENWVAETLGLMTP